ncbi:MAG TPA: hypothetical protein VFI54_18210 [Solirubrobacteraceae bacterium]|nr:hypothetical protein [Solirubrobacteraceae bacterium]
MRTVLITLIGPERTSDLVVDADTNVEALLPNLLVAGGVPESARDVAARPCRGAGTDRRRGRHGRSRAGRPLR